MYLKRTITLVSAPKTSTNPKIKASVDRGHSTWDGETLLGPGRHYLDLGDTTLGGETLLGPGRHYLDLGDTTWGGETLPGAGRHYLGRGDTACMGGETHGAIITRFDTKCTRGHCADTQNVGIGHVPPVQALLEQHEKIPDH